MSYHPPIPHITFLPLRSTQTPTYEKTPPLPEFLLLTSIPQPPSFAFGGLFQALGYLLRILCHQDTSSIALFVLQNVFIVLAPVLYAASIYMCLGAIIVSQHPRDGEAVLSPLRARWVSWGFLAADWVALNVVGGGAGMAAADDSGKADVGRVVVLVGLGWQCLVLVVFLGVGGWWGSGMVRAEKGKANGGPVSMSATLLGVGQDERQDGEGIVAEVEVPPPWRTGLRMLGVCSVLILVRSVFRFVEYVQGVDGYLLSNEWPLYVFDAGLMLVVQVVYVAWFPGQFRVRREKKTGERWWLRLH